MRGRLLAVAILIAFPAAPLSAQDLGSAVRESYRTNLRMLEEVADSAVDDLLEGFHSPGKTLLVEAASDHEANWFIESLLLSRLSDMGYTAFLKETPESAAAEDSLSAADSLAAADSSAVSGPGTGPRARTGPGARNPSGARTPPAARTEPAGPAPESEHVFRYRVVELGVSYPDSYRKNILGSRQVQRLAKVNLNARLLEGRRERVLWSGTGDAALSDIVPSGKLSLLEGESTFTRPTLTGKGLSGLVEPALVTGIVAGLIYLFYTNQN